MIRFVRQTGICMAERKTAVLLTHWRYCNKSICGNIRNHEQQQKTSFIAFEWKPLLASLVAKTIYSYICARIN